MTHQDEITVYHLENWLSSLCLWFCICTNSAVPGSRNTSVPGIAHQAFPLLKGTIPDPQRSLETARLSLKVTGTHKLTVHRNQMIDVFIIVWIPRGQIARQWCWPFSRFSYYNPHTGEENSMYFYLRRNIPETFSLLLPPSSPECWPLASSLYKGHRADCVRPVESQSETWWPASSWLD